MITRMAVIVPAADEQEDIGACLLALARARRQLHRQRGAPLACRVVVVLDGCRDATASVVARFADVETVTTTLRRVGAARAMGVAHALQPVTIRAGDHPVTTQTWPAEQTWLASTDADSRVPRDWLVRMRAHADRGDDLVVGTVRPTGLPRSLRRRWNAGHDLREGHPHVHGANLGIRASSYARLGGWSDLASHEDVDLVDRAVADGTLRIRRSATMPVRTSSRRDGRTPAGFAGYVRTLETEYTDEGVTP